MYKNKKKKKINPTPLDLQIIPPPLLLTVPARKARTKMEGIPWETGIIQATVSKVPFPPVEAVAANPFC